MSERVNARAYPIFPAVSAPRLLPSGLKPARSSCITRSLAAREAARRLQRGDAAADAGIDAKDGGRVVAIAAVARYL